VMHDGMQYDPIQGQVHEPFKTCLLRHLQWELTTDYRFFNWGTISQFVWARSLIFGLVFLSRDFEVGTNVSCEESTVSPCIGLIFCVDFMLYILLS